MDEPHFRSAWAEVSADDAKLLDVWKDVYAIELRLRDVIERNPHIASITRIKHLVNSIDAALDWAIPSGDDIDSHVAREFGAK